jgi:hypothetical protein
MQLVSTFGTATIDVLTILPLQLVIAVGTHLLHERGVDNAGIQGIKEVQEPNTSTNGRVLEAADGRRAWLVRGDFAIRPLQDLSVGNGPVIAREGSESLHDVESV